MAKRCSVCDKGARVGNKVSHAHNQSKRKWYPNLQKIRVKKPNGSVKREWVCTSCIQKGKIAKAVA